MWSNLESDWFIRTLNQTHTCLQTKKLRAYQVEADLKIPLRAIQDHFQKTYQVGISMDKVFRTKDMARKLSTEKKGFKACLRDLVGLDGAFMKGPFPSQVLTAVGLDSNNGIYPLAYAIVESENTASWKWFLENLGDDLELGINSNYTFISSVLKGAPWRKAWLRRYEKPHNVAVRSGAWEGVIWHAMARYDVLWRVRKEKWKKIVVGEEQLRMLGKKIR
uniref:MULE transposase domain-containing protein n=1 Tax=Lactuca sativa TaxID=4236 RepID=A0A9R1V3S2_LACSA|nr:hypothetical protein LSAT_V11C600302500 [Lactuca sativa]